jgi:hypothetical protein
MDQHQSLDLQRQGANARAAGLDQLHCPFYAAAQMPAVTGETAEAWVAKVDAWTIGWRMEDAMRGGLS